MTSISKLSTNILIFVLLSTSASGAFARADDGKVRKEIEAAYAKRDKGYKDKDADAIESVEAPDFKAKSKGGNTVERAQVDAGLVQLLPSIKEIRTLSTSVDKVTPGAGPDEFIVSTTGRGDFTLVGPDGAAHQIVAATKTRDVWVHTKDGWKIKLQEEIETSTLLDGKPLN
jgi:hypothetical protein